MYPTLATLLGSITPLNISGFDERTLAQPVTAVVLDSRQVVPGCVFVALTGAKLDGRTFINDAMGKGCLAVVVEDMDGLDPALPMVQVVDAHAAVGELAAAWYGYPADKLTLVGITGTNGKTTSSWLIEGMLLAAGCFPGVIGTVTYRYHGPDGLHVIQQAPLTTPDPVTLQRLLHTMVEGGATHVIMEVSSHALDQDRVGKILFDVALFTNLSRDHLDYHKTMEAYFQAKQKLFTRYLKPRGKAVVVTGPHAEGHDWGMELCKVLQGASVLRCGLAPECGINAQHCTQTIHGCHFDLHLQENVAPFSSPLTGSYNVLNLLVAAGVGMGLGIKPEIIRKGLSQVASVPGRLERVALPGAGKGALPAIFVDYAHTPDALENVLQTLKVLAPGRLICIFGCGGDRDRGKRPLMGGMAARYADVVIVTSDNPRTENADAIIEDILPCFAESGLKRMDAAALLTAQPHVQGYAVITNRHEAIATTCSLAVPADTILIAGKGHEDYQIIGTERHYFDDRREAANGLLRWNEGHLLAATGGEVTYGRQRDVLNRVSTDSRTLTAGDIFVALKGENFDGHAYIPQAVQAGARAVIVEEMPAQPEEGVLYIKVKDCLKALGDLAGYRRHLLAPSIEVIGITGSSGKTSVKEMVAAICASAFGNRSGNIDPVLKTKGNFNNLVGLPLSLLPLQAGHKVAIMEMGMSAPGEIARLVAIADPDVGCINNVHPAHLQGLGSIEGVAAAKGELFAGMRADAVRVVNEDDAHVREQAKKFGGTQVGFAVVPEGQHADCLVQATEVQNLGEQGMSFTLHIGSWEERITVPVCGEHNVHNCTAAAAIAHAAGIAPEHIVKGLVCFHSDVDKRLSVSTLAGGVHVVNDAYNANPASMEAGLRTVRGFGRPGCRHWVALGDMLELGADSNMLHQKIGALVGKLGFNGLAVTGGHAALVVEAAVQNGIETAAAKTFSEPAAMAAWFMELMAQGQLAAGDWLFIKGSRGMRMERLIEALEQHNANTAAAGRK